MSTPVLSTIVVWLAPAHAFTLRRWCWIAEGAGVGFEVGDGVGFEVGDGVGFEVGDDVVFDEGAGVVF